MPRPPITTNASTASTASIAARIASVTVALIVLGAAPGLAGAASRSIGAAMTSSIEFVAVRAAPAPRPAEGLIVLDLEGLESADAALALAEGWRQRHGGGRPLICWLLAPTRARAAEALGVLTRAEAPPCTRILVPR
jgi:hypothetical protein